MFKPYAASRYGRIRARLCAAVTGGPKAHRVPARWLRPPKPPYDAPICVFVLLARGTRILPHSADHARAWRAAGFRVVVVVVSGQFDREFDATPLDFADAILLRPNRGYDFGAWAAAIRLLRPTLRRCPMLAIANDSVLGPSANFASVVERARRSDRDLIGLAESNERAPHYQSFALFFGPGALGSRVFWRFWNGVRSGGREYVVDNYEVMLRARFKAAGLRAEALFPARPQSWYNPTITGWRALLGAGFPYLKVELLRDNPEGAPLAGWRGEAAAAGFDLAVLDRQLAALEGLGGPRWAHHAGEEAGSAPP